MDGTAVKEIAALEEKAMELKEVDGNFYSPVKLNRVYSDPRPSEIVVKSLSGILDYLKANVDGYDMKNLILHVVDHETVCLYTKIQGETNERHCVLKAVYSDKSEFPFKRFIGQESFIISCRSMFCPTVDMSRIIRYTSKIDSESSVKTQDDGITQIARIKMGASGVSGENEELPVIVKLRPYRTFTEIEQPESEFLFRMKADDGQVDCALFDADGGGWKNTARDNIALFLAESGVPVIS